MSLNAAINGKASHPLRSVPLHGTILVLGLAAAGLVLLSTARFGAGVSPDSTAYLSAAESLLAGKGYVCHDGLPYTGWPPLFPTLLAALGLLGVDPVVGARFINALAMGAIVIVSGALFARHIRSRAMTIIATLSVVSSLPLLSVSIMAWTEPVFVLLIVLFLRQLAAFLNDRRVSALVKAALVAALCSLQRYTGVTAILTGAVVLLFPWPKAPLATRLKHAAGYLFLSCAPLGAWALRNHALTSMFTGAPRIPSRYSLGENIRTALDTITAWFWPATASLSLRVMIVGAILLVVAVAFLLSRRRSEGTTGRVVLDLWPPGLFILIYLPFMTHSHQVGVYDELMNDRYLVPVSIPVLWLIFIALDRLRERLASVMKKRGQAELIVAGLCALWLYCPVTRSHELISSWIRYGTGGYSSAAWEESELVNWLRENPLEGRIYCNAPDALSFLTNLHATTSPHRSWDLAGFQEAISAGPAAYLVWFNNRRPGYLVEIEELMSALCLERHATLSDGHVYRLLPPMDRGELKGPILSTRQINGTWHRSFASETFGRTGLIRSWLLHADGTTDGVWELRTDEGTVLTWRPHGRYTYADGTLAFSCEGEATESGNETPVPYFFQVQGTLDDYVATGTYRMEWRHPSRSAIDRGTWRVDLAQPVYRLWSRASGAHFYTISRAEANGLADLPAGTWVREGVAFCAYLQDQQPPEARPVYRLLSRTSGRHFYTMQDQERAKLLNDPDKTWHDEGIAFYAYDEEGCPPDAKPVHRFWAATLGAHVYTMDQAEKDKLIAEHGNTWAYEGIVWYALPRPD